MKKSICKKITVLILVAVLASSVLVLSACNKNEIVQKGIIFDNNVETITATGFDDALIDIICLAYEKLMKKENDPLAKTVEVDKNNPPKLLQDYFAVARKADDLLKNSGITETQYIDLRDDLVKNKDNYATLFVSINKTTSLPDGYDEDVVIDEVLSFALTFCRVLGKENFSKFAYDLYGFRLQYILEDLQKNSISATVGMIEDAKHDITMFESIDIKEFEKLLCGTLLIFDIMNVKIDAPEFSLSDSETAKLIQIPDFNVNFSITQWAFVLRKLGDLVPGYFGFMFDVAEELANGGISTLSTKMQYVVRLIMNIQAKFDEKYVNMLRNDQKNEFALDIIKNVSEEDWDLFEGILSLWGTQLPTFGDDAYSRKADMLTDTEDKVQNGSVTFKSYLENSIMTYDAYTEFMADGTKTPEEKQALQQRVDDRTLLLTYSINKGQARRALENATIDNIKFIAEGILGGISPAFTYGLHNKLK